MRKNAQNGNQGQRRFYILPTAERAKESTHYITQSLELLEEIQKTGDIIFPRQFITAVLNGHQSPTAAYYVKKFLQEHPDFPYRLKNKVLMASDLLFTIQRQ